MVIDMGILTSNAEFIILNIGILNQKIIIFIYIGQYLLILTFYIYWFKSVGIINLTININIR